MKRIPLLTVPSVKTLCFIRITKQNRETHLIQAHSSENPSCGRSSLGLGSDVKEANGISRRFQGKEKGLKPPFG